MLAIQHAVGLSYRRDPGYMMNKHNMKLILLQPSLVILCRLGGFGLQVTAVYYTLVSDCQ